MAVSLTVDNTITLGKYKVEKERKRQAEKQRRLRACPRARELYNKAQVIHNAAHRKRVGRDRLIAVLDFETDPFDCTERLEIQPFTCCIYSPDLGHNVFWSDDPEQLIAQIIAFLATIEQPHTIYAHNGGKFDWLFFIKHLKGAVLFKGRAIMSAVIGIHTIRDSMHIIPAALSAIQKDEFDYTTLYRDKREQHKDKIIQYMKNDCTYLYDNVKTFVAEHGLCVSIGQASMAQCRKAVKTDRTTEGYDEFFREFYYGGRVECLAGYGEFTGDYKLYDVNSMYPAVMAQTLHPTSTMFESRTKGYPEANTFFIELYCKNDGALVGREENGALSARVKEGRFKTTIHEFNVAIKHNKISDIRIISMYDYHNCKNYADFIMPLYNEREQLKIYLKSNPGDIEAVRRSLILKLLMNNCYGKFAQNPRKFMASYLTNADEYPPEDTAENKLDGFGIWGDCGDGLVRPKLQGDDYWIWERPNPGKHFNNVAVAASITGAARAKLFDAICQADDPIYCDTDSLICKELRGVTLDDSKLGAWGLEQQFTDVLIGGKKLYACRQVIDSAVKVEKIRHKGISHKNGLTWAEMKAIVVEGKVIQKSNFAPTFGRDGSQVYITRNIQRTEKYARNK